MEIIHKPTNKEQDMTYSIFKVSPNDRSHLDDLVFEFATDIIGNGQDVASYLNEEISKDGHGIFSDAHFIDVRRIGDDCHTIEKTTRIDAIQKVAEFEQMIMEVA